MPKKIILITGAASGIGRDIAFALSKEATLILTDRNPSKLRSVHRRCSSDGAEVFSYAMDFSSPASVRSGTKKFRTAIPRIDWIVNCAGTIERPGDLLNHDRKTIETVMRVNMIAPCEIIKELWAPLRKGNGGIFMVASTAGLHGNPRFPIYSASKAAIINLTESLAKSDLFRTHSKKAIILIPGPTNTPMRQRIAKDAKTKQSPSIISQWLLRAIQKNSAPSSGSSVFFVNGKISKRAMR
ncbi:MAG: SDR family NAD(P)-dependent oxidoreductase [Patescibacteria group bacterium]